MAESDGEQVADSESVLPSVPVSAGALIFDHAGRLLILKPTYKSGWTIPGGIMEADGESPWQACQREIREECGLEHHRRPAGVHGLPADDARAIPAASATCSTAAR